MGVLITYDLVEGKQTEVKDAMKRKGYQQTIPGQENGKPVTVNLPNTTLWKESVTPFQAREDLKSVIATIGSKLERVFATNFSSDWSAEIGVPYKN